MIRNTMNRFLVLWCSAVFCLLSAACTDRAALERALRYAGDNRPELEAVMDHYSADPADSLKLRAAKYLIKNMPYHMSYPAETYAEYCHEMDSLFRNSGKSDTFVASAATEISARYESRLKPVFDILNITAEYLIWNIDYSFRMWEESDFLQHITFDEFCEYVLPYKCLEYQPMTRWKEEWRDIWRGELDQLKQIDELKHNVRRATEAVTYVYKNNDSMLRMKVRQIGGMDRIDILDLKTLAAQPYGTCLERSRLGIMNCRSKALPVSFDFTPNWADRNGPHYWNNVYVSRRRSPDFEPFSKYPGAYHYPDVPMGKVFRLTYAPHPLLMEVIEKGGRIPKSMSQLFMRDVTSEYGRVTDIKIDLLRDADTGNGYAYLAVFNNSEWIPMDICRIKRRKAQFNDVQLDILYIVATYDKGNVTPISDPFIVNVRGEVEYITPSTDRKQDMRVNRKFPSFEHIYDIQEYIRGGVIEADNDPAFPDPKVMAELPSELVLAGEAHIDSEMPFRYWRLRSSTEHPSDFAELYFYSRDSMRRISGTLIYPDVKVRNKTHDTPQYICDGDPLTYFTVQNTDAFRWVGLDFGRPVAIGKIAYIRRGDGNEICPGDEYELYYWHAGRWELLDSQIAGNIYLDFADVPADGLYFIKGLSRGVQNRTFIYKNGSVVWY